METLIVICLIIVIILLLKDKIVINRPVSRLQNRQQKMPDLPDIVGQPKPVKRQSMPMLATKSQINKSDEIADNFEVETKEKGFAMEIPQEELDDVFGSEPDFEEEEEEWKEQGLPNSDNGFARGVTFAELTTVGTLLEKDDLEPALQEKAVDIVQRLQGTELYSLLENSMEGASKKIAALLDKSLSARTDFSSSDLRKSDLGNFDIGEFV